MTGSRSNPSVSYQVTEAQPLSALVFPAEAENKAVTWSAADTEAVSVSADGMVAVRQDAGWFTDTDGSRYYLHAVGDGTRGRMYTGWNLIDGSWYYFNTVSDGTRGALYVNRETPDGYRVDLNGVWIQ